jgi:hypothetical protein
MFHLECFVGLDREEEGENTTHPRHESRSIAETFLSRRYSRTLTDGLDIASMSGFTPTNLILRWKKKTIELEMKEKAKRRTHLVCKACATKPGSNLAINFTISTLLPIIAAASGDSPRELIHHPNQAGNRASKSFSVFFASFFPSRRLNQIAFGSECVVA